MGRAAGTQQTLEQTNGTWFRLGVITSAGGAATSNKNTAVPFNLPQGDGGARLLLINKVGSGVAAIASPAVKAGPAITAVQATDLDLPLLVPVSTCLMEWQDSISCVGTGAFTVAVLVLA